MKTTFNREHKPADKSVPAPRLCASAVKILLAIILILIAVLAISLSAPSEPKYHNLTLSQWLERYNNEVDAEPQRQEAVTSIRQIGTNALPVAIRWLGMSDSKLKIKLISLANKQSFINFHFTDAYEYHERAKGMMRLVGPAGKSAIPDLEKLLHRSDTARCAAVVLCMFGQDALPSLISGLTNQDSEIRLATIEAMQRDPFQFEPPIAIPVQRILLPDDLISKLREASDPEIRNFAIEKYWEAFARNGAAEALKKYHEEITGKSAAK